MFLIRFLCLYKTAVAFDIIKIINKMNKCADKISGDMNNETRKSLFYSYDFCDEFSIPHYLNENCFVFFIREHKIYIKRIIDNDFASKMDDYFKYDLDHKNIQKNYLCFSQKYNNRSMYWFITEQNSDHLGQLCYFRKRLLRKLCRDVCQGLIHLHGKNIICNNINRSSIIEKRRLNKDLNVKMQLSIQNIVNQLHKHNCQDNSDTFTVLTNYYSEKNIDPKENINPGENDQTPEKIYDLKVTVRKDFFGPECTANIYICITSDTKWFYKILKANDKYVTSLAAYEEKISEIFKFFLNERPRTKSEFKRYEVGFVYTLDKNELAYKRFMEFQFDINFLKLHTTFTKQTLKEALLEAEIDFKISNIENCFSIKNNFIINDLYKEFNDMNTPPEYFINKRICFKSDIWRLGILVHNLICSGFKNIYPNDLSFTELNFLEKLKNGLLKNHVCRINDDDAIDFINTCLNFDPDLRPTAFELLNHPYLVEKNENKVAK